MTTITLKGKTVHTNAVLPKVGEIAPSFVLVCKDLTEKNLEDFDKQKKVLNTFPSMDTAVCSQSIQTFYTKCRSIPNLVLLNISMDLPFAAVRFCQEKQIENAITLSAFRSSFLEDYGIKMTDGPLKGLSARAVFVLEGNNQIAHVELVPEITEEPNYTAAFEAIQKGG